MHSAGAKRHAKEVLQILEENQEATQPFFDAVSADSPPLHFFEE